MYEECRYRIHILHLNKFKKKMQNNTNNNILENDIVAQLFASYLLSLQIQKPVITLVQLEF